MIQDSPPLVLDSLIIEEIQASSADVTCAALFAQNSTTFLIGNDTANILIGTNGSDVMSGLGGNDIICGFGGNDTINGGTGNDWIIGGNGSDIIIGGNGTDACDGTTNDTSVTECELQLPEGSIIETFAVDSFEAVNALITSIQSTITSIQNTLSTHAVIHDEVNKVVTAGPVFLNQDTIFQALCHPTNEYAILNSSVGIVTNGTDTISNIPTLNVGNLTVIVDFEIVSQGLIMEVTNTNLQNVTGEASIICLDHSN